jgi:hypothetical protein
MKALVCLAAVCLIAWCAVDIAIKLLWEERFAGIARSVADPPGVDNGALNRIAHSLCMIAIPGASYEACKGGPH